MSVTTAEEIRATPRGTPLARSWTEDWIARVEAREDELDRRICGARTIGGTPCPQAADHASGRCGHHGGAELTGAPDGNRNAAVHMLYSRRLMTCGEHCPMWSRCPLGGGAADKGRELLKLREVDRPTCPFEQSMYNAVVTDAERRTRNHHENAWGLHVAHTVALMTVMFSRAAASLGMRPYTDKTESYHGDQLILTERYSPQSLAFDKLGRELRRWTLLLERGYEWISCDSETKQHHERRQRTDVNADPDSLWMTATAREFITDAEAEEADRQQRETAERNKQAFRKLYYTKLRERFGDEANIPAEYQDSSDATEPPKVGVNSTDESNGPAPTLITPSSSPLSPLPIPPSPLSSAPLPLPSPPSPLSFPPSPLSFPRRRESTVETAAQDTSEDDVSVAAAATSQLRSEIESERDSSLRGNDKMGPSDDESPLPPGVVKPSERRPFEYSRRIVPEIFEPLKVSDPPGATLHGLMDDLTR